MAANRRVHEIAKELGKNSKELLAILQGIGVDVKAVNSAVTPEEEAKLRARLFGIKAQESGLPQVTVPDLLSPSAKGVRLRKKAPLKHEEKETPAEAGAEATAGPRKEKPARAKTAAEAKEKGAPDAGAKGAAKQPEKAGAAAVEGQPPAPEKGDAVAKETGAAAERAGEEKGLIDEIDEDKQAKLSADAVRRLTLAERSLKPRVGKSRPGKVKAKRLVPDAVRRKTGKGKVTVGPPRLKPKKKVRLAGEATAAELALALDVATDKIHDFFSESGPREVTPLTVLTAEEQEAAARALDFDVEAKPRKAEVAPRRPVVTVLGHVDHGKTTLLDALRHTNVVATESGGITQHVGASVVVGPHGDIVFIDTPGHEVFTNMRARGAQVTDVVVLVVAADDGVMPQTIESISHAKAAKVPIVVAITKVDKPEADPLRVKKGLAEHGVTTEDWGGEVLVAEVSALKSQGLEKLVENISLQAEIMELKGDPGARAEAIVVESELDRGRGAVITVLVKRGTLKVGDAFVVAGKAGRVRAMFDVDGKAVKAAGPAQPVTILGAEDVPAAGDVLVAMPDDRTARNVAAMLTAAPVEEVREPAFSLDDWYKQLQEGGKGELNLVVKADVAGSAEALVEHLAQLGDDEVSAKVLHSGVGAVNESDVLLAAASQAIVVAFRTSVEAKARKLAEREGVEIRPYDVIYEAIEDVKAALEGLLEPEIVTEVGGTVEVRQVFDISGSVRIAGCFVKSGHVTRSSRVRLVRDDETVFEGPVASLKRYRDDVKEVQQGFECGIQLAGYNEVEVGDALEVLEQRKVARRFKS